MKSRLFTTFAAVAFGAAGSAFAATGPSQPDAWVSGLGNDVAGCGATTSPCRTFQYAHDHIVASGGSIYVKDSADYSPIAISHAISIINDSGATATIVAASGDAIDIQTVGGNVHLRGLTLDGAGQGTIGVNFSAGASLTIENSTIKGFAAHGVSFAPTTGTTRLTVTDSIVSGNRSAGVFAILQSGDDARATGSVSVTLTRVDAVNNYNGVDIAAAGGGRVSLIATQVNVSNNSYGFIADSGGVLYLSRSMATGNGYGVMIENGTAYTYGDNAIDGNTSTNVAGVLTHVSYR